MADIANPYVYLHGLLSSPGSKKLAFFREKLNALGGKLHAPDLNVPTFDEMTVSAQFETVSRFLSELPGTAAPVLIGSSFGALSTLLYASAHPKRVHRVVLIAPALRFVGERLARLAGSSLEKWRETGYLEMVHPIDDKLHRLRYGLVEDAARHDFDSLSLTCPVLVVHGTKDEVIPFEFSKDWVAGRANAVLVPIEGGDHGLLDHLDEIWRHVTSFE